MPNAIAARELTRTAFRRVTTYDLPLPPEGGDLPELARSFDRMLQDQDYSPNTEYVYLTGLKFFGRFLEQRGMPQIAANITAEHIGEFFRDLSARGLSPNTRASRFRALAAFFRWLKDEGEIRDNPMLRLRRPKVEVVPPPIMPDEHVRRLLATCRGGDPFLDRRDEAIIRLFFDIGIRRSGLAYLRVRDVDLNSHPATVTVVGKNHFIYAPAVGRKAAAAIDRYLRMRARHKYASHERLWLGRLGPLSDKSVDLMLRKRARMAGVKVHAHMFRHLFAHSNLSHPEAKEGDVAAQGGWRGTQMLRRYGAAAAEERARQAHVRLGIGDRL
jgi:site-specific recombinase XerD